jgi:hypothetical protein
MTALFDTAQGLSKVYVDPTPNDIIVHTVELSHPQFTQTYRLCSYPENLTCNVALNGMDMQTFTAYPFRLTLPANDASGQQSLVIAFANATRELSYELERAAKDPLSVIQIVYRVYLLADLVTMQATPIRLAINAVSMTNESINATASRIDLLNKPFPNAVYRNDLFPGLVR